jgi:PIN domain nuclease of toxin-antitoxin system
VRVLLDTHAFIWAVDDPRKLGRQALIVTQDRDNELLLSAATIWEIAIKVGLGKLKLALPYRDWMIRAIGDLGSKILPITVDYADTQAQLPAHHGDPFDRMLVSQSLVEKASIVSHDAAFDQYGISRVWQ